jgi:uridine phosphorylase
MEDDRQIQSISNQFYQRAFSQGRGIGIVQSPGHFFGQQQNAVGRKMNNQKQTEKQAGDGHDDFSPK